MNSTPIPIRALTMRTSPNASMDCPFRESVIRTRAFSVSGLLVQMKHPPSEISEVTPLASAPDS